MKDGFPSPLPENFPIRINIETKRVTNLCFVLFFFKSILVPYFTIDMEFF